MAVFSTPLLFSLYTNDCTSKDTSVKLLKFADDTTLIGLIQDGDESAYRQEVKELAVWFSLNNLELNTLKTVEMIADFSRTPPPPPPHPQGFVLFAGSVHSKCKDAQSRLAASQTVVNIRLSDRTGRL